jgi:hypothetical protein
MGYGRLELKNFSPPSPVVLDDLRQFRRRLFSPRRKPINRWVRSGDCNGIPRLSIFSKRYVLVSVRHDCLMKVRAPKGGKTRKRRSTPSLQGRNTAGRPNVPEKQASVVCLGMGRRWFKCRRDTMRSAPIRGATCYSRILSFHPLFDSLVDQSLYLGRWIY